MHCQRRNIEADNVRASLWTGLPVGLVLGFFLFPDPTGIGSLLGGVVLGVVLALALSLSNWSP